MYSRIVLATALALTSQATAAETALAPARMAVTLEAESAVATGVTPGATVAWLGVSRDREEWLDHLYHWRLTAEDADKDGIVRFPRKEGFPGQTILVAVDLVTGGWAVGGTYPLESGVAPPELGSPKSDAAGLLTAFSHRGSKVDILVARAGGEAWSARVLDGGPLDADGVADGIVTVGLAALPSRGGKAGRLDGIRPGDVVAMVGASGPWARVVRFAGNGGTE